MRPSILAQHEHAGSHSFEYLQQLRHRDHRERLGQFLIEGVRFVCSAEQHGAAIEALFYCADMLNSPAGCELIERHRSSGGKILELSREQFRGLSLLELPQGIGAVVRTCWSPLAAVPARDSVWLSLDTIRSPGNLGTILRTSAAAGAAGCLVCGDDVDPFDPRTIRATMGTLFAQRLVRTEIPQLTDWAGRYGVRVVGTSPDARLDYREASYRGSIVLMIGGERRGLSPEQLELCDTQVRIPMAGMVDSLNVGVATGILLYEAFRQRRATPLRRPRGRQARGRKPGTSDPRGH